MSKKVIPPRPTAEDPQIVDQALVVIGQKVQKWQAERGVTPAHYIGGIVWDLQRTQHPDAYQWAKGMERWYAADTGLVMILAEYPEQLRQEIEQAEVRWVKANNLIGRSAGSLVVHPQFGQVRVCGSIASGYSSVAIDHRSNPEEYDKMLAGTGGPYRKVKWEDLTPTENAHQITET